MVFWPSTRHIRGFGTEKPRFDSKNKQWWRDLSHVTTQTLANTLSDTSSKQNLRVCCIVLVNRCLGIVTFSGFLREPRGMHARVRITDITSPSCSPLDILGWPDPHPSPWLRHLLYRFSHLFLSFLGGKYPTQSLDVTGLSGWWAPD